MNETVLPSATFPVSPRRGALLYALLPGLMLILLVLAFGGRYLHGVPGHPFPWYVHLHAVMFTGWIVMVISQAALIRSGAVDTHRRMGIWGMALAVCMVVIGIYSAIEGARRGHNPARFRDALAFMAVPLTDILLFGVFMLGAWWSRRRAELHKRCVLLAMLGGFGWPIITRLPMIIGSFPAAFGTLAVLVLIPPLVIALVHRRFDWLTAIGGVAILASVPLRRLIGESQAWHDFARAVIA